MRLTLDQSKTAYRLAKKIGFGTSGSVIIGPPVDTKETAMQTTEFAESLKDCDQMYITIYTPYPGAELYDTARKGLGYDQ